MRVTTCRCIYEYFRGKIDDKTVDWQLVLLLVGSCVWLFIATVFKMPVSGTHSIVGATVGFALVAHGAGGVDWKQLGLISKQTDRNDITVKENLSVLLLLLM